MARKANRSRSQTLSLRISPIIRFGLECVANNTQTSMTNTIERAVVQAMGTLWLNHTKYLSSKFEVNGKVKVTDIITLAWHEDEVVRLLRTGILAPSLLSAQELFMYKVFSGEEKYEVQGKRVAFEGDIDVFEEDPVSLSADYQERGPRFDLARCQDCFETVKEIFNRSFELDKARMGAFDRVTVNEADLK